ncbi:histidine phosphatase family protein, partial [Candidatus Parcubacteria bacterium]|nr:histidine phosphatase family protein [Candidatus Parcubacteria bacterium]
GGGQMSSKTISEFSGQFANSGERITKSFNKSETYPEVSERMWDFLQDMEKKYQGKHILAVSHECPIWLLSARLKGISIEEALRSGSEDEERIKNAEFMEVN